MQFRAQETKTKGYFIKRSKVALAITLSISALFLTACNDNNDDYTGVDSSKTPLYESNYAIDAVNTAASIKVMTCKIANVQGRTATATAMVLFPKVIKPTDGCHVVVWEYGTVGAMVASQMSPNDPMALAVPTIDQIADGYAELLAYAALASAGIKVQQPNYDYKQIFTSGAADIADLAYGRTAMLVPA